MKEITEKQKKDLITQGMFLKYALKVYHEKSIPAGFKEKCLNYIDHQMSNITTKLPEDDKNMPMYERDIILQINTNEDQRTRNLLKLYYVGLWATKFFSNPQHVGMTPEQQKVQTYYAYVSRVR